MKKLLKRYVALLRGRDKGAVAISFLLSLPILMSVIGIITQFGLLANARLTVDRAVAAAARSAMTALPTDPDLDTMDGVSYVNKSARMALEGLSPVAQSGETQEATEVAASLRALGLQPPNSYGLHYSYAQAATTLEWTRLDNNDQPIVEPSGQPWQPGDFARARGQKIQLTVHYKFFLSVPGIRTLIGKADNVAGVDGCFVDFTSSYIVQLAPGREAGSNNNGWAN